MLAMQSIDVGYFYVLAGSVPQYFVRCNFEDSDP